MSSKNTMISIFVVFVIALMLAPGEPEPLAKWGYAEEDGPKEWASLDERYEMCAQGMHQSPINIVNAIEAKIAPLLLDGKAKATNFVNNGHTVQANFTAGNKLTVDGADYSLKQVHFHTPSENTIDGKSFPMEAHFVHTNGDALAVVGVMFEIGSENATLNKLLRNLPENSGDKNQLKSEVIGYEMLPKSKEYYRFSGSLTTPPCSEGVKWFVLKTPVQLSESQLKDFNAVMPVNNRPVQEINARTILH